MYAFKNIVKNMYWLAIGNIINYLFLFILFIFMARYLGDVGFGKYSFAATFTGLFAILSDLGLGDLLIREASRSKSDLNKYFSNVLLIKGILSLITYLLIIITINLMNSSFDTKLAVYILGFYALFDSFVLHFFCSIFRAFEKMEHEALVLFIKNFIITSLSLVVVYFDLGFFTLVSMFLIGNIISFFCCILLISKYITKFKFEIDFEFCKQFLEKAIPFSIASIFCPIYFSIDKIMLSLMKGDAVVGWYSSAATLVYSLIIIPGALNGSIFPIMSRCYINDKDSIKILYQKSFKYLFIFALPIAVGTTILADKIILLFLGTDFTNSVIILQILVWVLIFIFLNPLISNVLGATDNMMLASKATVVLALSNIILNLLLIPQLGAVGAAIATIITEGSLFFYLFYCTKKYLNYDVNKNVILKSAISCFFMAIFLVYVDDFGLYMSIFLAMIIYFIGLLLTKCLTFEEYANLKQVFGVKSRQH